MSEVIYQNHLGKLSDSFARSGVDVGTNPNELDVLCNIETALRSGMHTERLTDLDKGFNGLFMEKFRALLFLDYLEYRKVYLSMTLDEFCLQKGIVVEEPELEVQVEEEPVDVEEPDETDYTAPVDPRLIDTLLSRAGYMESGFGEDDDEDTDEVEELLNNLADLKSEHYGVDKHGFDIWHIIEDDEDGFDDDEVEDEPAPVIEMPSFEGLDQAVAAQNEVEMKLLTECFGEDALGFDIWVSPVEEESKQEEETEKPLDWDNLLSEHYGVDDNGFDLWVPAKKPAFELEEVEDGFDHSGDADRDHLGELLTKFYGFDEHGFDVWSEKAEDSESKKDLLKGVKTEQAGLGELLTEPFGVDSNGFDLWLAPEVKETANNTQSSVSSGQGTQNGSMSVVTASHAPHASGSPVAQPRVLEEEDKMYLLLSNAFKTTRKAMKRFWS